VTNISKGLIAATAVAVLVTLGTMAGAQEKKATTTAAKSKCNAITEETACRGDTTCIWIGATTNEKTGKTRKAYCKTKPAPSKKKTT
jgi:hypothetical protein